MKEFRVDIEDCELLDDLVLYEERPFSGVLFSLYESGELFKESEYENGLPHGISKECFPSGQLKRQWFARNGRQEGKLVVFHANGVVACEEVSEFGVLLSTKKWDQDGNLVESSQLEEDSEMFEYVEECRRSAIEQ